jgi:hypothetical protein
MRDRNIGTNLEAILIIHLRGKSSRGDERKQGKK